MPTLTRAHFNPSTLKAKWVTGAISKAIVDPNTCNCFDPRTDTPQFITITFSDVEDCTVGAGAAWDGTLLNGTWLLELDFGVNNLCNPSEDRPCTCNYKYLDDDVLIEIKLVDSPLLRGSVSNGSTYRPAFEYSGSSCESTGEDVANGLEEVHCASGFAGFDGTATWEHGDQT
jgi:hypothetical protein